MALSALPEELLRTVFSVKARSSDQPLLDARDRVRCQAVCSAWRRCLHPSVAWPLEVIALEWSSLLGHRDAKAAWLCRVRPPVHELQVVASEGRADPVTFGCPSIQAVHRALQALQGQPALQSLSLEMGYSMARRFWPTLCSLSALAQLTLDGDSAAKSLLDASMLGPLHYLERLSVHDWARVRLVSNGGGSSSSSDGSAVAPLPLLLPRLSQLTVSHATLFELDAPLCTLRGLSVLAGEAGRAVDEVRLAGSHLCLPSLVSLSLHIGGPDCLCEVDFSCMPALAALDIHGVQSEEGAPSGISRLGRLTHLGLHLSTHPYAAGAAVRLLQQATSSLQSLELWFPLALLHRERQLLACRQAGALGCVAAALSTLPQLSRLVCNQTGIVPHLGRLQQLRELRLEGVGEGDLGAELMEQLAGLPALCTVSLGRGAAKDIPSHLRR